MDWYHPSHKIRMSGPDKICTLCGATDGLGNCNGNLIDPCQKAKEEQLSPEQYYKIWSELLNNPELEHTRFKISIHELRTIINIIVNAIGSVK